MYSRNTWNKRESYTLPPGYDGSRFRRRHRRDSDGSSSADEVIIVPDSAYSDYSSTSSNDDRENGELSVGGIPTSEGIRKSHAFSAHAENNADASPAPWESSSSSTPEAETASAVPDCTSRNDKTEDILQKLGFPGGLSSDDLLLCAIIFIIASDRERTGDGVGDILLILALLLGIR